MRRTAILAVLVACGGGPAPSTRTFTDSTEPAGGGRESPGTTRDPASGPEATPSGRDAPPPSQDPPPGGGSSSGSSGAPTECFPCQDVNYTCTGTIQGQEVKDISLHVQSKDGSCVYADQQVTYVFACNRKITANGVGVGTWATNADGITVTLSGVQLTCVPQRATPGGGGSSSGNNADAG